MKLGTIAALFACSLVIACGDDTKGGNSSSNGNGGEGGEGGQAAGGSPASSSTSSSASTASATSSSAAGPGGGGSGGAPVGGGGSGGVAVGGAGGTGGVAVGGAGGTGGGGPVCAHDLCTEGDPLDAACDPCAALVCSADDVCCDTTWDDICVGEAIDFCAISCGSVVLPGDLVISEIMNNPAVPLDADGEWFEVFNASPVTIDLLGLVIAHQPNDASAIHVINQSVPIPSGGYAVLGINADPAANGGVLVDYEYTGVSLNNTSDYLAIQTDEALPTIIDEVFYDQASGLDPDGASRNLDPASLDASLNDDDFNWCEASSFITGNSGDMGTPGAPNDICFFP